MEIKIIAAVKGMDEVLLYDTITPESDSSAKSIITQLRKLKGEEITVRINSRGGDVFEGMAIFSYLQSINQKVNIIIDGIAASMASIIAMAGDTISIAENGFLMIHNPSSIGWGQSKELKHAAANLDKFAETMREIYAERTGLEISEITEMMDAETWMNAKEAIKKNFADQISAKSKFEMAAVADLSELPEEVASELIKTTKRTAPPQPGVSGGTMEEVLLALGVTSPEDALAAIGKLKSTNLDLTTQKATLENRITALNTRLGKLEEDNAVNLVDIAIAAGDILPKDKAVAEALLKADPEKFQNWKAEQKQLMGIIRGELKLNMNDDTKTTDDDIEVR